MQGSTPNQMNMQMKHRLSGTRADVDHGAVSVLNPALASDLRGHQVAAAQGLGIFWLRLLQTTNVFLGNDKDVRWPLRIDVFKRVAVLVLIDFLGRYFTTDNAAKKTILHDHTSGFVV
jgi:hypothetical protein